MIKFSIVVPVYNTPCRYLRKCLNSIMAQTYTNREILVVDDGSTNAETLKLLSKLSDQVTVFHKSNEGQASARNLGIDSADGGYIIFIDSDDYWLSDSLLLDAARLLEESWADVLSFSYTEFFDEAVPLTYCDGSLPRAKVFGKTKEESLKALLRSSRKTFSSVTHTKIIKTEFLRKNGIRFVEKINNEDTYFTVRLLQLAETFDRLNKVGYAFRRSNMDSDTQGGGVERQLKIERDMITVFDMMFMNGEPAKLVLDFLGSSFVYWMGKTARLQAMNEQRVYNDIRRMQKYSYVMCCSSRWYVKVMGYLTSVAGLPFALWLLGFYLRINCHHMLSINRKTGRSRKYYTPRLKDLQSKP